MQGPGAINTFGNKAGSVAGVASDDIKKDGTPIPESDHVGQHVAPFDLNALAACLKEKNLSDMLERSHIIATQSVPLQPILPPNDFPADVNRQGYDAALAALGTCNRGNIETFAVTNNAGKVIGITVKQFTKDCTARRSIDALNQIGRDYEFPHKQEGDCYTIFIPVGFLNNAPKSNAPQFRPYPSHSSFEQKVAVHVIHDRLQEVLPDSNCYFKEWMSVENGQLRDPMVSIAMVFPKVIINVNSRHESLEPVFNKVNVQMTAEFDKNLKPTDKGLIKKTVPIKEEEKEIACTQLNLKALTRIGTKVLDAATPLK